MVLVDNKVGKFFCTLTNIQLIFLFTQPGTDFTLGDEERRETDGAEGAHQIDALTQLSAF